jgi:squalene synthase HpnC
MIRRVVEPKPNAEPQPELSITVDERGRPYSVEAAYAYCERMARGHYENFPVASRFVPQALRRHMWAVYAFARSADDFADEPRWAGRRAEALRYWEDQLEHAFHGEAQHPVFVALKQTFGERDLPISPLRDLLTSFSMDLSVKRYPTWSQLERYMMHSAHPVGRLVLYIFGYDDPSLQHYSDDICAALHLTNFLQDMAVDLTKDHIYLPEEDLKHFGVTEAMLFDHQRSKIGPEFRDLMRFQVARARALFERGRPLVDKVGPELGFELAMIWNGGMMVLDKIEASHYDVFRHRPTLNAADKARMVTRAAKARWPQWNLPGSPLPAAGPRASRDR